jgi:hypothetical protein
VVYVDSSPIAYVCWTEDWDLLTGQTLWRIEDQGSVAEWSGRGASMAAVNSMAQLAVFSGEGADLVGNVIAADDRLIRELERSGWRSWRCEWDLTAGCH